MISRYLPPKTSWGFTKAKAPWLPGRRKWPGCVLLESPVIPREEEGLEALQGQDIPQQALGCGCRLDQQFPISLHAAMVFQLPKWCTVPTLLLQTIYSPSEMSPTLSGSVLWGKWLRICQGGDCSQGKPPDQIQQGLDHVGELPRPSSGAGLCQSSIMTSNFPRHFSWRLLRGGKDSVSLGLCMINSTQCTLKYVFN